MRWSHQERWILALGGLLREVAQLSHEWIGGAPRTAVLNQAAATRLATEFGVAGRDALLARLNSLQHDAPNAWALGFCVSLAGLGYRTEYLDDTEFFERLRAPAERIRSTFDTWAEFGHAYVNSPELTVDTDRAKLDAAIARLLRDPRSPWVRLPWRLSDEAWNDPVRRLPASPEERALKSTQAELEDTTVHSSAARTEAERFALAPLRFDALLRSRSANVIPEHFGTLSSRAGSWRNLAPELRDAVALREHLETTLCRELNTKSTDRSDLEVLAYNHYCGILSLRSAVSAKLLPLADAWHILVRSAAIRQATYSGWSDFFDCLLSGAKRATSFPLLYGDVAAARCLKDEALGRLAPWTTDLTRRAQLAEGLEHFVVSVAIHLPCPRCERRLPIQELCSSVTCEACHYTHPMPPAAWEEWLAPAILDRIRTPKTPTEMLFFSGEHCNVQATPANTRCRNCRTPLPIAEFLQDAMGELPASVSCTSCQQEHPVQLPGKHACAILGSVRLVILDPPEQGESLTVEPAQMACVGCGATTIVDGTSRIVTCPYCHTQSALPESLYRMFHAAPGAPRLRFVCDSEPLPLDHVELRQLQASLREGSGSGVTNPHSYLHLNSQADSCAAAPTLSCAQRFATALIEPFTLGRGGDPERWAAFPLDANYRYLAIRQLESLKLANGEVLATRLHQRVERALGRRTKQTRSWAEEAVKALELSQCAVASGLLTVPDAWGAVVPLVAAVQKRYEGFQSWFEMLGAPAIAPPVDWNVALDTDEPHVPNGGLDLVSLRLVARCPGCLNELPVGTLHPILACPRCRTELQSWPNDSRGLLEDCLFLSRSMALDTQDRYSDARTLSTWDVTLERCSAFVCDCGRTHSLDSLIRDVNPSPCPCGRRLALQPFKDARVELDPSLRGLYALSHQGNHNGVQMTCAGCGAPLASDAGSRVVDCPHCRQYSIVPEATFRRLNPPPTSARLFALLARSQERHPCAIPPNFSSYLRERGAWVQTAGPRVQPTKKGAQS